MTITWKDFESSSRDIYTTGYQIQNRNYWNYSAAFGYGYSIEQDIEMRLSIKYSINKVDLPTTFIRYNSMWNLDCSLSYDIFVL